MGGLQDYFDKLDAESGDGGAERRRRLAEFQEALSKVPVNDDFMKYWGKPCDLDHLFPSGPNEDIGQCRCGAPIGVLRPEGETYGWHIADCSLPLRHRGYCVGGGSGHEIPTTEKIRGWFP